MSKKWSWNTGEGIDWIFRLLGRTPSIIHPLCSLPANCIPHLWQATKIGLPALSLCALSFPAHTLPATVAFPLLKLSPLWSRSITPLAPLCLDVSLTQSLLVYYAHQVYMYCPFQFGCTCAHNRVHVKTPHWTTTVHSWQPSCIHSMCRSLVFELLLFVFLQSMIQSNKSTFCCFVVSCWCFQPWIPTWDQEALLQTHPSHRTHSTPWFLPRSASSVEMTQMRPSECRGRSRLLWRGGGVLPVCMWAQSNLYHYHQHLSAKSSMSWC